ncbi:MAG: NAD(P)-dependent oxidoreductase [Coriobacteriia bacterium]|nr:NAD(P)-dependent oxidoreductase [Coriobacteriia bacterium]
MMRGRVLITGADGFVGRATTAVLMREGYDVLPTGRASRPADPLPGYRVLDVTSRTMWEAIPACEALIHCAGVFGPGVSEGEMNAVNVGGTQAAVDWAASVGVTRFVLMSSGGVYGPSDRRRTEADEPDPQDAYARSKLEAERLLRAAPIASVILRLYFPVGAGQSRGVVARLARQIILGEAVRTRSDGGPVLTLTDVREVARCAVAAVSGKVSEGCFNVGGSKDYQMSSLIRSVAAAVGREPEVVYDESLIGDWRGDSTRIEQILGSLGDADDAIRQCAHDVASSTDRSIA